jgi:transposase
LDWRTKVELYEQIRREYEFGAGSIIGVARKLVVHRRTVREAVRSALPARRKKTERPHLKIAPAAAFIDEVLAADRKAPRKQRHTAKRIWERIRLEVPGCTAAERTVRQYVERRKQEQGFGHREIFVPQNYEFGVEVQVDWYEAYADLDGERIKLQVFSMRSMASGAAYHRAYLRVTQQAFLEAHELAFHYFGGVFRKLRYDNLSSAVKKILRGYEREMTARFIAFRSHWQYEASFCTPGEGHEKGGVEGEVGYFRRNHWVPVPAARDLADLNAKLFADCRQDENRMVAGRTESTGLHYCLVTEIFFWPTGTISDPIPVNSTPASSDRLAQRNLAFDSSGNPGFPSTHLVQHTFMVKPSSQPFNIGVARASAKEIVIGPDELMIEWGNVPRSTEANLFFPEVGADEILSLSALRQHPAVLTKVDDHTISVRIADVTFIPLPSRPAGNLAGLVTLTLPEGIRVGQNFKLSVQQYSGIALTRRAHKMLGAFQFNIPVQRDADILPKAVRNLSILRYIQQTIAGSSRWSPIFTRWLNGLATKVAGLGGDPNTILPSPTGGDMPAPCHKPEPCEVRPRDLWCMNIPWDECDIEGEVDVKLRFRKKCK